MVRVNAHEPFVVLYRVVSDLELSQVRTSGSFRVFPGGAEGTCFWERLVDAQLFASLIGDKNIVCATYLATSAERFTRFRGADAPGHVRFARHDQMNDGLLGILVL